jgi:phosphoenolpyruvate-protein kinase (PTS system EI component)
MIGTMIEIPRACLTADQIAETLNSSLSELMTSPR